MTERAERLQNVAFTSATVKLSPPATTGMARRAAVAQSQPALLGTACRGAKMHRSIDRARASIGQRHRSRLLRRRHLGRVRGGFTGGTRGVLRQTRKGFGLLGTFALEGDGHRFGWPRRGRSTCAWPSVVQYDTEPQESQDRELVVHMVRYHGNAPSQWGDRRALDPVLGQRNYPHAGGTRPCGRDVESAESLYELVASFHACPHGSPWPSWRPRAVAACGHQKNTRHAEPAWRMEGA